MPESDPLDQLLNALVADQVWRSRDQARMAGLSTADAEATLRLEAWRLLAQLLQERYDGLWPESESWLTVVSCLLECDTPEATSLTTQLINAGWLDHACQPTAAGRKSAGLPPEN
jgi:hypothetical protein